MTLKGLTRRSILSMTSLFLFFFLQLIIGLTRAGFDMTVIKTIEFWIDIVIQSGLNIFGMINGQQMGIDMYLNNPDGAYRMALIGFTEIYEKIEQSRLFSYFDRWLDFFKERKLKARKEQYLLDNDVKQFEVLDLSVKELDDLELGYRKDWSNTPYKGKYKDNITYFMPYSKKQIKAIRKCIEGGIRVDSIPSSTFRNATSKYEKDMWDSLAQRTKRKGSIIVARYSYKIVTLVAMAIVFEGLRPGEIIDNPYMVLLDIGSKIITVGMAFVFGINVGADTVKVDTQDVKYKTSILKQYKEEIDLGIYKITDIQTMAKEEYEKNHKGVNPNGIENEEELK